MKRNEVSLRDLWDNIKRINSCITEVPEERERKELRKYLKREQLKMSRIVNQVLEAKSQAG